MCQTSFGYSTKDEELGQFVRSHLVAQELNVFLASISITPCERGAPAIVEQLRNSEWVFLLASKNAFSSQNVQLEIGGAIFDKKKLVPIHVGCAADRAATLGIGLSGDHPCRSNYGQHQSPSGPARSQHQAEQS